jgi:outer membrane protein assembly factor BamC
MKNRFWFFSLTIATAVLAGCSYLQSFFPDKERDYQYTTEIPMINWPAELRKNQAGGSAAIENSSEVSSPAANLESSETSTNTDNAVSPSADKTPEAVPAASPAPDTANTTVTPASASDEKDTVSSVDLLKYDDGESRLRLDAGFSKSWRVVSKALSRKSIEVTERNHEQGLFTVQYDPDEKKAQDESILDEIGFFFHGINSNDCKYFLKLEEHGQQTDVIVLNEEQLPLLNDDAALRLLKVLADTIKADLADKAK